MLSGQPRAHQDDDQPLGTLGDADRGRQADPLGARADVGRQRAEDEAQQAAGEHPRLVVPGEVPGDGAEHGGVDEAVGGRVEDGSELGRHTARARHRAVDDVEHHAAPDEHGAREPPALREEDERPGRRADGADDRDLVGCHAGPGEPDAERVDGLCDPLAAVNIQHAVGDPHRVLLSVAPYGRFRALTIAKSRTDLGTALVARHGWVSNAGNVFS